MAAGKIDSADAAPLPFEDFYHHHRGPLVRYAQRQNALDAEGVADLALFDLYRAFDRMHSTDERSRRAYVYRAASSHIAREHRRPQEVPVEVTERSLNSDMTSEIGFEQSVIDAIAVEDLVGSLPPDQRDVLQLRFLEDMSSKEVGHVLGKKPNAVRQLQHRGLRAMRRIVYAALVLILAVVGAVVATSENNGSAVDNSPADSTDRSERVPTPSTTSAPQAAEVPVVSVDNAPNEPSVRSVETTATVATPVAEPDPAPVYEPFDLGLADGEAIGRPVGASSVGFAPESTWTNRDGSLRLIFDGAGLSYADAAGNQLATTSGALRVKATLGPPRLTRPLAEPFDGQETYWVSYLLRLDSDGVGDAFWTPDGHYDRGGAGFQQTDRVKSVNGGRSETPATRGETVFVVVKVAGDTASLWTNPNLVMPGDPTSEDRANELDLTAAIFRFNDLGDGAYTIDEFRIGDSFAQVAPVE